ncbi:MAG: hypothetical protein HYX63_03840 [Gammaproteobacteria bacterium]|nr:hypothetical protein [Gammaproteobacteria bacterium]
MSATLAAGATHAQQAPVFAYPNAGQSQEQQSKDRFECHQWSVSQSGFDPSTAPPVAMQAPPPPPYGYSDQPPPPPQNQGGGFLGLGNGGMFKGGGMVGDAATGAALGAAGGALAGNAGQGAAIGALASTMLGAVSRSSTPSQPPPQQNYGAYQQQQYQQQRMQADQSYQDRMRRTADYNQAFGACMKARNYTVN